ncbi:tRNA guanosine(34) transglycosylase Tgt [bacterium]|jgi:queuine tRNA-ribosyltransferase|nr:tRNA guanosine(34) transglycosylase Tgt [bacterium]NBW58137.1 tRNA guanosine(34) transglycosylase Tgt [bacterium]NBX72347.1 tRNA guanosine(34) transglycosylase Tgt [bacterium]
MTTYPNFKYIVTAQTGLARCGQIHTPHGVVETPNFIFCATKAAIKGATPTDLKQAHTQIILSNTYHLFLQPGADTVAHLGGLHKMLGWDGPMFTDSGGYQIFSLGHGSVAQEIKGKRNSTRNNTLLKITEEGAYFRSYLDGSKHVLTPEIAMQVQRKLGADLIVVLDECTPYHVEKKYTQSSMRLSHRWGLRSLDEFYKTNDGKQAVYGIVQGGVYDDLRQESVQFVNENNFFANAIGGSLGASKQQMHDIVNYTASLLRKDRPTHLLGIGGIVDIFNGVRQGIDTFDCVHPTRLARHGGALLAMPLQAAEGIEPKNEHINLRNARFALDTRPIDETCGCSTCQTFSRGYLHHLIKAKEMLVMQALTVHNIYFMNRLMKAIRQAIQTDSLDDEQKKWIM